MDVTFKKFCQEINFKPDSDFEHFKVENAVFDGLTNTLKISIVFDHHIPIQKFKNFLNATKNFSVPLDIDLGVRYPILDTKTVLDYLIFGISIHNEKLLPIFKSITLKNTELVDGKTFKIKSPSENFLDRVNRYKPTFENVLKNFGYTYVNVELQKTEKASSYKKKILQDSIDKFSSLKDIPEPKTAPRRNNSRSSVRDYKDVKIKDLDTEYTQNLRIKGQIYGVEYRKVKEDFSILKFIISDFSEAKLVKQINPKIEDLKDGEFVEVSGQMDYDNYIKQKIMNARDIKRCEPLWNNFKDNAPKKRVELAARSNMSTQDGIVAPADYINVAKRLGHEAVALVDTDGVQGYPEFYKEAQNSGLKPIYGATMSVISKANNIVYGSKDFDLKHQRYVVFDLETSGLSPIFDEIIEFGAVVVKDGMVEQNIQFFMKPSKPISSFTTELTHITNEMLNKHGISQEEGAKRIHEILQMGVVVAHNAAFDINHSRELFKKFNLPEIDIMGIDSMNTARILFPQNSKFRLSFVSKKFDIFYDDIKAHRADQDAKVLSDVWIKMISKLERDLKITNSSQLRTYIDEYFYRKKFSYEIRFLAKNQAGLKHLFKIISKASTDDYNGGPRVFLDDVKHCDDLFIGTATHSSYFWDKVFTSSSQIIEPLIQKYDYIEFAPISTWAHKISRGEMTVEEIQDAYKMVINLAKKYSKICVAVSDCRYIDPIEKLIHQVYIFADGVNATKHWLFSFRQKSGEYYPTLDFKTTEAMLEEFSFLNDERLIEDIVINNTHLIANQIEDIQVIKDKLYVPTFDDSPEKLKNIVYETAYARYGNPLPEIIKTRIEKELNPIIKYGYSVIYWISHKLIKQAADDGWLVGSRGSVGSSIVANLSGITEVNPLSPHYLCPKCKFFEIFEPTPELSSGWDLPDKKCPKCNEVLIKDGQSIPFETFLGFNADKVPDIDLNFSGEYQSTIHKTVRDIFGEKYTFRAGTILKIKDKTGYGFAKKYDEIVNANQARFTSAFLDFIGKKCENVKRTTGQHAGGIIIIPKQFEVEDFTPVSYPANDENSDWKTTHFDFRSIHDNVLKLDLLGKDDPTTIRMLEDLTNIKYETIPKSDDKVLSLFYSTEALGITPDQIFNETTGVKGIPEFGTRFVRGMLKTYKTTSFADLIGLSGLSHGTDVWAGNAEELVKNMGLKLSELVCCRDDIMGYLLRNKVEPLQSFKIMEKVRKGKGITEEEEKMLVEHNVPQWYIDSMKKIKYMFPKAHATAYVIMAWRIAWYKVYYPLEYYATYFTTRAKDFEIQSMTRGKAVLDARIIEMNKNIRKLTSKEAACLPELEIAQELYARGYKILPVSIERSLASKWIIDYDQNAIIPPFNTIDSMGLAVADSIVEARNENPIISIEDLMKRTKVNSRIEQTMRDLGILDNLDEDNQIRLF